MWRSAGGGAVNRPRQTAASLMLDFIIVQMGLIPILQRQLEPSCAKDGHACRPGGRTTTMELDQHEGDAQQSSSSAVRRLTRLKSTTQRVYKLAICLYSFEITRYALLELLKLDYFQDYQLIDCFALGRVRFVGRTNRISQHIAVLVLSYLALCRVLLFKIANPFRFQAIEFLLHNYDEVQAREFEFNTSQGAWQGAIGEVTARRLEGSTQLPTDSRYISPNDPSNTFYLTSPFELAERTAPQRLAARTSAHLIRSPQLEAASNSTNRPLLRPNRTAASWRALASFSRLALVFVLVFNVLWVALIGYNIGGFILSQRGFGLSYSTCAAWLQRRQRAGNEPKSSWPPPYASIYVAPALLGHQMQIDETPSAIPLAEVDLALSSPYQVARALADVLENCWIYVEGVLIILGFAFLFTLSSLDVSLNARNIETRLSALVARLDKLRAGQSPQRSRYRRPRRTTREVAARPPDDDLGACNCVTATATATAAAAAHDDGEEDGKHGRLEEHAEHDWAAARHRGQQQPLARLDSAGRADQVAMWLVERCRRYERDQLKQEIASLQAILLDHFQLVRTYNRFISFFMLIILSAWVTYSLLISTWMGSVSSRALESEFLVAEVGGTVLALLMFSGAASTRSSNYRLYRLLASAMARDHDLAASKLRWTTLMKYYWPNSNYCFTLFGSLELSWLFCLQFVWYVVSVYIVLSSFIHMGKH